MKLSLRRLPLLPPAFMKSCTDGTFGLRPQASASSKSTPPTLMAPANRECRTGCISLLWSSGGTTNPPIEEVGPTIVFDTAFDSEQSVGGRFRSAASRVFQPGNGMRSAGSDSVRPANSNGLEEEQNDINRSCRLRCVPVLSIRRRRKDASNRGSRPAIDFDAAFGGEQALAADFDQRHLAFINPIMGCALLDRIRCGRQIQMALRKNKNDTYSSCRTGCFPVLSVRRRRDEASERGSRPTIVFDAAFGGEQALAADFDQRHLAFSLSKVNGMHLAELDKARFGKFNRL